MDICATIAMPLVWRLEGDSGSVLTAGKWIIGAVSYDKLEAQDGQRNVWCARARLPGIKAILGHFPSAQLAKEKVEESVAYWFRQLETVKEAEEFDAMRNPGVGG